MPAVQPACLTQFHAVVGQALAALGPPLPLGHMGRHHQGHPGLASHLGPPASPLVAHSAPVGFNPSLGTAQGCSRPEEGQAEASL